MIQHYTRLCKMYPQLGDKPGDGVFVLDEGVFHLDTVHYQHYVAMLAREQSVTVGSNQAAAPEVKFGPKSTSTKKALRPRRAFLFFGGPGGRRPTDRISGADRGGGTS